MPKRSTTHVPEHFYVEVALTTQRAQVRPLLPAWRLRRNLTIADDIYVVLARSLGADLVTGDRRLAQAPNLDISVIT